MQLPLASTGLTGDAQESALRPAGTTMALPPDVPFAAHLQAPRPAREEAAARPPDEPRDEPSSREERAEPAPADDPAAAEARPITAPTQEVRPETDAAPATELAAPTEPLPTGQPNQAEPLAAPGRDGPAAKAGPEQNTAGGAAHAAPSAIDGTLPHATAAHATTADTAPASSPRSHAEAPTPLPIVPSEVPPGELVGHVVPVEGPSPKQLAAKTDSKHRAASASRAEGASPLDGFSRVDASRSILQRPTPVDGLLGPTLADMAPGGTAADKPAMDATPEGHVRGDLHASRTPGLSDRLSGHLAARTETPTSPAQHLAPADQLRMIQRVARAMETAAQRGGILRLRLRPPELGALRLEVSLQPGKLAARIETETQLARTVLLEHLPQLRERLAEQGIHVEQFDVDVSSDQSDHSSPGPHDSENAPPRFAPTRRADAASPTPADTPSPDTRVVGVAPGTLNVVI